MVSFTVLTVFRLFLTIGILLVHCWYSLGRPVTIGTSMANLAVLTVFDDWYTVGTNSVPVVKNSQKTVKTAKMTIGVPVVTYLHRVRRIHKAIFIARQHSHAVQSVRLSRCGIISKRFK